MAGWKTAKKSRSGRTSRSAMPSGLRMERYFGASSPRMMWRKVIAANPSATEKPRNEAVPADPEQREERLEQPGEIRLAHPAERQAGQGDAELRGREVGVEMAEDMPRQRGPPVVLLDQRIELAAAHLHQRKLRRDEKAVQEDEQQDAEQMEPDHAGGVPLRHDLLCRGEQRGQEEGHGVNETSRGPEARDSEKSG